MERQAQRREPGLHHPGPRRPQLPDPLRWLPGYPNPAFVAMQPEDGAWMARILARVDDADLAVVAGVGDPRTTRYAARLYAGASREPLVRWDLEAERDGACFDLPAVAPGPEGLPGYRVVDVEVVRSPGAAPLPPARLHLYDDADGVQLVGIERPKNDRAPHPGPPPGAPVGLAALTTGAAGKLRLRPGCEGDGCREPGLEFASSRYGYAVLDVDPQELHVASKDPLGAAVFQWTRDRQGNRDAQRRRQDFIEDHANRRPPRGSP